MKEIAAKFSISHDFSRIIRADIKDWRDWYTVSTKQFQRAGGFGLYRYYGYSMSNVLMKLFPEYLSLHSLPLL